MSLSYNVITCFLCRSIEWRCSVCGCCNHDVLLADDGEDDDLSEQAKQDEQMAAQISFESETEVKAALAKQKTESKPNATDESPSQSTGNEENEEEHVISETQPVSTDVAPPLLRQRPTGDREIVTPMRSGHGGSRRSGGGRGLLLLGIALLLTLLGLLIRRIYKVPDQPHLAL